MKLFLSLFATSILSSSTFALNDPVKNGATTIEKFLSSSSNRVAGASSKSSTISLLGKDSIIDCPGNAATDVEAARTAKSALLEQISSGVELAPGTCRHQTSGKAYQTYAQVCNHSKNSTIVDSETSAAAFDLLYSTCSESGNSGTLKTESKLFYTIFTVSGNEVPSRTKKRASRVIQKRCTESTQLPVTGCEDDVCDPKITLNESGDCPNVGNDETDGCTYHCELRAARFYGPPQTFDGTSFCSAGACSLTIGTSYTVEKSVSASLGIEGGGPLESILSAGISFSYTVSTTSTLEQGYDFGEGKCGQWYKAPVLKQSCGKKTEYEPNFGGEGPLLCLVDAPFSNTVDWCATVQAKVSSTDENNATPDVRIIQRYANCADSVFYADDAEEQSEAWKTAYGSGNNEVKQC